MDVQSGSHLPQCLFVCLEQTNGRRDPLYSPLTSHPHVMCILFWGSPKDLVRLQLLRHRFDAHKRLLKVIVTFNYFHATAASPNKSSFPSSSGKVVSSEGKFGRALI